MFIEWEKSLTVPVGWRDHRMWVLHKRSGGSIDRAHNIVLIQKKNTDIQGVELEATASRIINGRLKGKVVDNPSELGILSPIHDRVC